MYEPLKRDSHQFEHSGQFGSITRQFSSFKVSNLDFETPAWTLKGLWFVHFILSGWAMLSGFITVTTYSYTHLAVLGTGLWVLFDSASADAKMMLLSTVAISIVNDIIVISIYAPRTYDIIDNENANVSDGYKHEFRFALGMCISNLLLKPFSIFFIYREYCKTSVTDHA